MGIIVDAGKMVEEVQAVKGMMGALKSAAKDCKDSINAFMSDTDLTGTAYTSAKQYFSNYLPVLDAVNTQADSISSACDATMSALAACPALGYASEDALLSDRAQLVQLRGEYMFMANNCFYYIYDESGPVEVVDTARREYYLSVVEEIDRRIAEIDRIIEQLHSFDACSAFEGIEESCKALKASIDAICAAGSLGIGTSRSLIPNKMQAMRQQLEKLSSRLPIDDIARGADGISDEERYLKLFQWLHKYFVVDNGFTEQGSCGLIVNLYFENNTLNPGRVEGDKPELAFGRGYGLAQWTDNGQSNRQTELLQYLEENGYAPDSFEGQAAFIVHEIKGNDYYAAMRETLTDPTATVKDTIRAVCVWYEAPGGTEESVQRAAYFRSDMERVGADEAGLRSPKEIVSMAMGNQL